MWRCMRWNWTWRSRVGSLKGDSWSWEESAEIIFTLGWKYLQGYLDWNTCRGACSDSPMDQSGPSQTPAASASSSGTYEGLTALWSLPVDDLKQADGMRGEKTFKWLFTIYNEPRRMLLPCSWGIFAGTGWQCGADTEYSCCGNCGHFYGLDLHHNSLHVKIFAWVKN